MDLTRRRRRTVTTGLLLGISLGALEATVVGTAMPTVVSTLGGLNHYSWVFSAYLLTSTASVPIWGRLSDLYGRRRLYLLGILFFMIGSALAGASRSMPQLIVFRAIQGIGAGALIPLSLTIIGEIYTVQERARMQAVFSSVWGVASIGGPLVGGWLTDAVSWRWVFYINLPFGLIAALIIGLAYPGDGRTRPASVDWAGALLLFASISTLLVALSGVTRNVLPLVLAAAILGAAFWLVEQRAAEPILPLALFAERVVSVSLAIVFLVGMALFGAVAFIPLFVQGAMHGSATEAGRALTPLFLGWVGTSIASARLTLRIGYRPTAVAGIVLIAAAFVALAQMHPATPRWYLLAVGLVLGGGMGFAMLSLLLAIQHGVAKEQLGLATSMNQFSRSVGAAVGVSLMGAILFRALGSDTAVQIQAGLGSAVAQLNSSAAEHLAAALRTAFGFGALVAALAIVPAFMLPPVEFGDVPAGAGEELLAAEMTSLEPEDEPSVVRRDG